MVRFIFRKFFNKVDLSPKIGVILCEASTSNSIDGTFVTIFKSSNFYV